ncbi:MAG TPA: NFACT family protein, partial [bacterium]
MTPLLVALLRRELEQHLLSGRLSHCAQSSTEVVELNFYHPDRPSQWLVIALLPQKPLVFMTVEKRPALAKPPNFCRSLRKQLEYAQLVAVQSTPGERLISFGLKTSEGIYRLVFEGLSKYPNLILVGPDNLIISALRYKNDVERPVLPQAPYAPPPQLLDKPDFWRLSALELQSLWEKAGRPTLGFWIKDYFRGTDSELASFLETFGESAFQKWIEIRKAILEKGLNSFTLFPGPPPALKVFPNIQDSDKEKSIYPTASQALEAFFDSELSYRQKLSEKSRLETEINRAIKHEKRVIEKLKIDRREAERSDQYQWWGEMLMAQLHKVKLHLSQVELEDVVRGHPSPVLVPLDPGITPLHNAQRFFKKAQKGSRGLVLVEKREKEIHDRLEQLKAAQRSLPALQSPEEIKKAFLNLFPKKPEKAPLPKKKKDEKVPTPNIIRIKLSKQFELCAGASAAANEYVTFQLAQPEDLWFHARDLPGAHVILRRLQRDSEV